MSHHVGLTPEQQTAVCAPDGPLLVVSGPGSGKTTVLAARIAYLVRQRGVGPPSILVLTFAAKAARQLRERLTGLLGGVGDAVDVATFHSFGLRVLRQWRTALGFRPGPLVVYEEARAGALLREVAAGLGLDLARISSAALAQAVERCRLTSDAARTGPLLELAAAYEAQLMCRNALDFPALLTLPLRLLQEQPAVAALLQSAYRAILVDETQDVCGIQYALLRTLAARHRHLVLVGDPAQGLYGWRGADGAVWRDFLRDFPETRVLTLRQNFRSTPQIVGLANAIGTGLPGRLDLWTANPPGPRPVLGTLRDEDAEAAFVATELARLLRASALRQPGEAAILYRTNEQAQALLPALRAQGLPCCLRTHGDLFARREVRDLLAYLRLLLDRTDRAALARIANTPPRGLAQVAAALRAAPAPVADLVALARRYGVAAVASAQRMIRLLEALRRDVHLLPPAEALELVLERTGYHAWLARQPDGATRLGHVAALRRLAERAGNDLPAWLAAIALGDAETASQDQGVRLLTIHAAKGGEWPAVFLVGWEEGLLPHHHALRAVTGSALDDERKVAYVGVTRPQRYLYVTCCRERARENGPEARSPSRFLLELAGAPAPWAA